MRWVASVGVVAIFLGGMIAVTVEQEYVWYWLGMLTSMVIFAFLNEIWNPRGG